MIRDKNEQFGELRSWVHKADLCNLKILYRMFGTAIRINPGACDYVMSHAHRAHAQTTPYVLYDEDRKWSSDVQVWWRHEMGYKNRGLRAVVHPTFVEYVAPDGTSYKVRGKPSFSLADVTELHANLPGYHVGEIPLLGADKRYKAYIGYELSWGVLDTRDWTFTMALFEGPLEAHMRALGAEIRNGGPEFMMNAIVDFLALTDTDINIARAHVPCWWPRSKSMRRTSRMRRTLEVLGANMANDMADALRAAQPTLRATQESIRDAVGYAEAVSEAYMAMSTAREEE